MLGAFYFTLLDNSLRDIGRQQAHSSSQATNEREIEMNQPTTHNRYHVTIHCTNGNYYEFNYSTPADIKEAANELRRDIRETKHLTIYPID